MPRVICALPNASDEINGIKFHKLDDGRLISDDVADDVAEHFVSIPGYELDAEESDIPPAKPVEQPAPTLTKAQQRALDKKAADEKKAADKAAEEKAAADKEAEEKAKAEALATEKTAADAAAAGCNTDKPASEGAEGGAAESDKPADTTEVF